MPYSMRPLTTAAVVAFSGSARSRRRAIRHPKRWLRRPILEGIAFIASPDALELAATDGSARFSQTLYTFDRLPDAEPWRATAPPALEATRVLPAKPLKKLMATLTPHIGGKQPIGIAMPRERHSLSFFMPDLTITIQALEGKPVQAQVEYFTQVSETAPPYAPIPKRS